eukprot:scaffold34064_cov121-Cyclotella_meneghiniana.AAC.7
MVDDDSSEDQDLNRGWIGDDDANANDTKASSSSKKPLAIPSGDDKYPGGSEVIVDEDSSQVMSPDSLERNGIFNGTMLLTNVKHTRLQRRHRCFIIASLLSVALLLLALLIAVPAANKIQKNEADIGTTYDNNFDGSDDIENDDNESDTAINEMMFTAATLYSNSKENEDTTETLSIHNIDYESDSSNGATTDGTGLQSNSNDNDEMNEKHHETINEIFVGSSTSIPQIMYNVETMTSTSSSITINNPIIDQNTGEEIIIVEDSVVSSTSATQSMIVGFDQDDESSINDGLMDATSFTAATKSTLIPLQDFKEPIDLVSTVVNIVSNDADVDMEGDASNDVSLSATSTIEPSIEMMNIVENNSLDGLISPFMSPNEQTDRESQWLKAHNIRRKQWHTENNVTYVPLRWSTGLTSNALVWAQVLIDQESSESFQLYHDDTAEDGENLAMNCGTGSWSKMYPPENILTRWVLWRATKFVGCADASREYDNGKTCHVQM